MNNKMMDMYRNAAMESNMSEYNRNRILRHIDRLKCEEINIMLVGSTGAGKSSTINALLGREIAKVGVGVDPETMDIRKYGVGNLIFWDTPGLGDGKASDVEHSKKIVDKLNELDKKGAPLIDLVLVIVDGSNRDMGTEYQFINDVIKPNIGTYTKDRVLVAINQADMAMKGNNWDSENNRPDEKLVEFLDKKVMSVHRRLMEATGIDTMPVYFAAGYKCADSAQEESYNINELFFYMLRKLKFTKRVLAKNNAYRNTRSNTNTTPSYVPAAYSAKRNTSTNEEWYETLGSCLHECAPNYKLSSYDDDDDDAYRTTASDVAYDVTMGFFNAVDSVLSCAINILDSIF